MCVSQQMSALMSNADQCSWILFSSLIKSSLYLVRYQVGTHTNENVFLYETVITLFNNRPKSLCGLSNLKMLQCPKLPMGMLKELISAAFISFLNHPMYSIFQYIRSVSEHLYSNNSTINSQGFESGGSAMLFFQSIDSLKFLKWNFSLAIGNAECDQLSTAVKPGFHRAARCVARMTM